MARKADPKKAKAPVARKPRKPKEDSREAKLKRLAELKRRYREKRLKPLAEYREKNRIYFFDTPPNPGPNPRQRDILEAWLEPFYKTFSFTGGERSGKTTLLTLIGLATLFGEFLWDNEGSRKGSPTKLTHLFTHNEPRKVRYVGQDWKEHIQDVVIPELYKWWPEDRPVKRRGNGIIADAEWTDLKTGSTLVILSNNQNPRVHRGWHGDLVLYDEPPDHEIYIANARGMVDRRGRELIAATLLEEPWIHQKIIKKKKDDGRPDPTVFNTHINSRENVGFGITEEGLAEYENKLSPEQRESRIAGIPSYLSGLICKDFSRKTHLRERFNIPLDWLVDIAIDTHPRECQAVLFEAISPRGDKYLVEEIWEHGDGTWVGEQIVRAIDYHHFKRVNRIICDPLAKGDQNNPNTTFDKIQAVLWAHGYMLETATKDKATGIREIKKHLKGPNNEPSLFIFDDLVRTIQEIEGWMWDKKTGKAVDKDDHMMENLYRLLMLGTTWFPLEWEDEDDKRAVNDGRNPVTGY